MPRKKKPVRYDSVETRRITELLLARHQPPEWASFAELRCGTGFAYGGSDNAQSMDVWAIHTWPSKMRTVGYEVKVTRDDFARELADPGKRRAYEERCGECLFAAPSKLIRVDEVPDGWGLITVSDGGQLRVMKQPAQREPPELDLLFIASICRASYAEPDLPREMWVHAGRELDAEQLLIIAEAARGRSIKELKEEWERELKRTWDEQPGQKTLEGLRSAVARLCGYDACKSGEAFEAWMSCGDSTVVPDSQRHSIRHAAKSLFERLQHVGLMEKPGGAEKGETT